LCFTGLPFISFRFTIFFVFFLPFKKRASQGGDKLTLALNTSLASAASSGAGLISNNNNLSPTTHLTKLVNLESASKLPKVKPPTPPPRTTSDPTYSSDVAGMDSGISMTTDIPISVTHFSTATNGFGVEKETIFMDGSEDPAPKADLDPASIVRKHLTNPFLTPEAVLEASPDGLFAGKFNTIGRTNPFSTPNRSRNPFLDNTTPESESSATNGSFDADNGKSEASPDASIDPTPILMPTLAEDVSKPTLNKIVSRWRGFSPLFNRFQSLSDGNLV
jgi:hypothetical protein